ncbi:TRAP transporter small permease subunit [Alcaligenaceae bacterium LF4-65]|jgi:TRAP-type C4-dicarboxylate transport system permease small subunit|uniref:TRAP transporter small permease protein n=1 Tax=Zwartia hollandica TaxID=324606 RepID=A0A953NAM6_9BURK|nr:TRAP transporter small permease [Zwartia hollandica]MBZ1350772.1 TRAP transporter small permease subunit [Zwartia hollandica]
MRKLLNQLYSAAEVLAAVCMVGVLLAVLTSILSRQLEFHVSGLDAYAGYFMASAGFLALASTLRHGEHIRVTLILNALAPAGKRRLDIAALAVGVAIALSLAVFSTKLVIDSYVFNDISTSNDATPLWIPQLGMAVGTILLLIAFIDLLVSRIRGDESGMNAEEQQRHE